jgi:GNAT superfamily N-acetyltransferase
MISITQAETADEIELARILFREYEAAIGIDLCFQNFDDEVAGLPGAYAPPDGRLLFARRDHDVVGCIALRRLDDETCEMKRLFVRPSGRGLGLGRQLAERLIAEARTPGYKRMRLDTLTGVMDHAIALYRELGFTEIEPYYHNPYSGTLFMEVSL